MEHPRRVVNTCEEGAIILGKFYASAASVTAEDPRVDNGSELRGRLLSGEFERSISGILRAAGSGNVRRPRRRRRR